MKPPVTIEEESFQDGWKSAVRFLHEHRWEWWNLIVHIKNPLAFDNDLNQSISVAMENHDLLKPKDVAYTIFPYNQYRGKGTAGRLFRRYNERFFPRVMRKAGGWGTYFRRMTHYNGTDKHLNQLEKIINAINVREKTWRTAYTIVIQEPGTETVRPRGGPCLNYVAVQLESEPSRQLSLLAVYRNHDFAERAYGNYFGLCKLLEFLAIETDSQPGTLTCVSSHAYVESKDRKLLENLT